MNRVLFTRSQVERIFPSLNMVPLISLLLVPYGREVEGIFDRYDAMRCEEDVTEICTKCEITQHYGRCQRNGELNNSRKSG